MHLHPYRCKKCGKRFFRSSRPGHIETFFETHSYWKRLLRPLARLPFSLRSFPVLLLLHIVAAPLLFLLLGLTGMWIALLCLVTLVGAAMVYINLDRTDPGPLRDVQVSIAVVSQWALLLFVSEMCIGFQSVPRVHSLKDLFLDFFQPQSPWIWMTYYVAFPLTGVLGWSFYQLKRKHRKTVPSVILQGDTLGSADQ